MFKKFLLFLGIAVVLLIGILLFNTFRSSPWPVYHKEITLKPLPDSAISHLSQAIQIPTVSFSDSSSIDTSAFIAFNHFIERAFPLVHQKLSKTAIRQFSYVFEWKGKNAALAPMILMGHYDVVPVEPSALNKWTVSPFSGKITDSCIWGRGAADDKMPVISILEATETMLQKGFIPERTIFLCFGHDEEVRGAGANAIVDYLEERKIKPELVIDEGGEMTESKIKDLDRPAAFIGVAEKGYSSFELSVDIEGGHSSMPGKETSIDILAAALQRLRSEPMPANITPAVKESLYRVGISSTSFLNRMAANNMWLFEGMAKSIISETREGTAMIHTTIVPTIFESGIKENVIPTIAVAILNSRILPGETSKSVEEFIRKKINDDRVKIRKVSKFDSEPSPTTDVNSPAYKRIESAVYQTVPNVIPTPYLMIGATDSRHYRRISSGVVNFFPTTDSKGYHGIDERMPIRDFQRSVNYVMIIIEESNKEFK
jgi:carboxypeptidase PM20D1